MKTLKEFKAATTVSAEIAEHIKMMMLLPSMILDLQKKNSNSNNICNVCPIKWGIYQLGNFQKETPKFNVRKAGEGAAENFGKLVPLKKDNPDGKEEEEIIILKKEPKKQVRGARFRNFTCI